MGGGGEAALCEQDRAATGEIIGQLKGGLYGADHCFNCYFADIYFCFWL